LFFTALDLIHTPSDGRGNLGQPSQDRAPTDFSRVIGSFNDIGMSTNCLRGLDDATQEDFRKPTPDRTVREHVSNIIKLYFEQQSVITQAQILHGLIKHKKMKRATKLLGFKDVKNKNACENVAENVTTALSAFGKSRKNDIRAARREITTAVVARSTSRNRMVTTMSKLLHVSRRTLHKYTKFRVRIDENDEVAC